MGISFLVAAALPSSFPTRASRDRQRANTLVHRVAEITDFSGNMKIPFTSVTTIPELGNAITPEPR
jgi:hypothetical protein